MSYVEIIFPNGLDSSLASFFTNSAAFWNAVITSAPVDPIVFNTPFNVATETNCGVSFTFPAGSQLDGLAIFSDITTIDGAGSVLGRAGPCVFDAVIPRMGIMEFDIVDVQGLIDSGNFEEVVRHEMAHVVGIGTVWTRSGFLNNPCNFFSVFFGCDPTYNRPEGNAAFAQLGGSGNTPVANTGGAGTQNGHWREVTFENELMTGFLSQGVNPASILTIRSLRDIGYVVDLSQAEPYSLPRPGSVAEKIGFELGNDVLEVEPVDINDVMGRINGAEAQHRRGSEFTFTIAGIVAIASVLAALVVLAAHRVRKSKAPEKETDVEMA